LAFVTTDGSLWLLHKDGSQSQLFTPRNGFVFYPEWSPDGKRVAFTEVSYTGDPPTFDSISEVLSVVVVDTTGNEVTRVTRAALPHWSPDSQRLSILVEPDSGATFIGEPAIADLDKASVRKLAPSLPTTDSPRWSPDGNELAYASLEAGLFVVNATGDPVPQLIVAGDSDSKFYLGPIWAGDGNILAFERDRSDTPDQTDDGDFYVLVNPKRGTVNRVPDSHPSKCGRSLGFFDLQGMWLPGRSLAAWTVECQSPAGLWIKSMAGDPYERFIDVSSASESIRRTDISSDGEVFLFSNFGPFLKWAPPLVVPGNEARFNAYIVRLSDGFVSMLLSEVMEAAFRP
jgi:Tol biopolymer transport system component